MSQVRPELCSVVAKCAAPHARCWWGAAGPGWRAISARKKVVSYSCHHQSVFKYQYASTIVCSQNGVNSQVILTGDGQAHRPPGLQFWGDSLAGTDFPPKLGVRGRPGQYLPNYLHQAVVVIAIHSQPIHSLVIPCTLLLQSCCLTCSGPVKSVPSNHAFLSHE